MEKARLAFALAWLISALMPEAASAKAPTVKITISGGPASPVEVTDPQVLAISDVWSGRFLDVSRSPENEAPKGVLPHEVSFYVKLAENDVRKMYVAYYYPNSATEQGFLYLPGKGVFGSSMWAPFSGKDGMESGTMLSRVRIFWVFSVHAARPRYA
jgi:hypothetical protein